jgi:hypothetical protein
MRTRDACVAPHLLLLLLSSSDLVIDIIRVGGGASERAHTQ